MAALCSAAILAATALSCTSVEPAMGAEAAQVPGPHAVQPERPTLATHAHTVAPGWVEIEAGIERDRFPDGSRSESAVTTTKIGLTTRTQLGVTANALRDDVVRRFEDCLPAAMACFAADFEAGTAQLRFRIAHRNGMRTTNLLERLFVEERRRTKVIPNFFHGERPVLKLMFAALLCAAERWRRICVSEFETRQLDAIRNELSEEHTKRTPTVARSSEAKSPSSISSKIRP